MKFTLRFLEFFLLLHIACSFAEPEVIYVEEVQPCIEHAPINGYCTHPDQEVGIVAGQPFCECPGHGHRAD